VLYRLAGCGYGNYVGYSEGEEVFRLFRVDFSQIWKIPRGWVPGWLQIRRGRGFLLDSYELWYGKADDKQRLSLDYDLCGAIHEVADPVGRFGMTLWIKEWE
jgi:hypothetical protein